MHRAKPARATRLSCLAVLAVAFVAALTLSQCKLVDERLTGVANPFRSEPERCMQGCDRDADKALRDESKDHSRNVSACNGDASCLALEQIRHENRVAEIEQQRQSCQNDCHHQGSGFGG